MPSAHARARQTTGQGTHLLGQLPPGGGLPDAELLLAQRRRLGPAPRVVETPAGMINAIGLQGIGVHRFVNEKLPKLRDAGARTFVNVCGTTLDEYVEVSKVLAGRRTRASGEHF